HRGKPPHVLRFSLAEVFGNLHFDPWYATLHVAHLLADKLRFAIRGPTAGAVDRYTVGIRSEQPIERHAEHLGFQIPKSDIQRRNRAERDTFAPEAAHAPEHVVPEFLDRQRVLADQHRLEDALDDFPRHSDARSEAFQTGV